MDRRSSGLTAFKDNFASEMKAPLTERKEYRIRLLVDKASTELFVNEGETVMSSIFFPTESMNSLRLFAEKGEMKVSGIRISEIK